MLTTNKTVLATAVAGLLSLGVATTANAQNNSTFLELGGNAGAYSLNYEKHLDKDWGVRVGVGSLWSDKHAGFGMPIMANKYWGNESSNHKFETGIGATIFTGTNKSAKFDSIKKAYDNSFVAGTATIGYRYQPKNDGMTFKAGFTPLFTTQGMLPWVGVSVGRTF